MRISSLYIAKHEDYQVLSPHAVRVFSLWILLYWKHQETTRDNRKDCGKETSHEIDVVVSMDVTAHNLIEVP
ncbi:hypothetical protein DO83_05550 [Anaerostipes hadrus]|uniref:Uncharacterized protein n=1 Tax=Anaerostipes hadrus TaxID=649756 RepID=A0A1Q2C5U8_ANAHA|nr:hypothetical protein DO83_05550 [Anaerostipes hadrus]OKZ59515.1 MAG: hypothetical protein BHV92_00750 [Clostridiales bacterium 45_37]